MDINVLSAQNITFNYGSNTILNNVNLQVHKGDFLGLVGSNGSGKSTFLKICLGLIKPQFGNIKLFGTDIDKFKNWKDIGYIPQKATAFNQSFPATVEEIISANLCHKLGFGSIIKKENKDKIDEVLDIVGMKEYKKRLIGRLSGGQQQRIFIAKSLVSQPKIIFMDEPTVGIDKKSEAGFYDLMEYLNKSKKITLVMITHDFGAILNRVNRVMNVAEGRIFETDKSKVFSN